MVSNVKVLGIVGGPHRHGNTVIAMKAALEGARELGAETELLHLSEYEINLCAGCKRCMGKCIYDDGMTIISQKLLEADGFLVGTPVSFGTMSSYIKIFIDRTRILRHNNFALANKAFGAISVAARRNGGQETALMELFTTFLRHGVVPVNNGPGTSQYGGTVWAGPIGEAEEDDWGLETCRGVGRRVAEMAWIIKTGISALNYHPTYEFSGSKGTFSELKDILARREEDPILPQAL